MFTRARPPHRQLIARARSCSILSSRLPLSLMMMVLLQGHLLPLLLHSLERCIMLNFNSLAPGSHCGWGRSGRISTIQRQPFLARGVATPQKQQCQFFYPIVVKALFELLWFCHGRLTIVCGSLLSRDLCFLLSPLALLRPPAVVEV